MRLLLITPPMTRLDTPYPATAYLMVLRQHAAALDLELAQADASIELFRRVFSGRGLQQILDELTARAEHTDEAMPPSIASLLEHGARYVATIDAVDGSARLAGHDGSVRRRPTPVGHDRDHSRLSWRGPPGHGGSSPTSPSRRTMAWNA